MADSMKTPSFVKRVSFDNSDIDSGLRPNPIMIKLTSDFLLNLIMHMNYFHKVLQYILYITLMPPIFHYKYFCLSYPLRQLKRLLICDY